MLYLAYGSNLHPYRLQQRISSATFISTVALPSWSLFFHKRGQDGSGKCNLIFTGETSSLSHAAIYKIAPDEKAKLDLFEGEGRGYDTKYLTVNLNNQKTKVFCYLAAPEAIDETLLPFDWYQQLVYLGARYHQFSSSYLKFIESIDTRSDSNTIRNDDNKRLVNVLKNSK